MNNIKHLLSGIIITITFNCYSQEFLEPHLEKNKESITIQDYQKAFFEWSKNKDLNKEKGWKSYKRWEEFNAERVNPDGMLPDPSVFALEVIRVAELKKQSATKKTRTSSWNPVGPYGYPMNNDPIKETGMGRINTITFHPTDPNTLWVGVAQGGVWKSTNHGESWIPLTDDLPILRISDIAVAPSDPDIIYISVGDYAYLGWGLKLNDRIRHTHYGLGVYKTTNGGDTWEPTGLSFSQIDFDGSLTRRVFIDPNNPDIVVAATTSGIYKSTDGGANWNKVYDELMWDFEKDPSDPNTLYATSGFVNTLQIGKVRFVKSTDFGDTWATSNIDIPETGVVQRLEISVSRADPNYIYAVACNTEGGGGLYGVYRSTDAGITWSLQANSPNILTAEDGTASNSGGGTYDLAVLADPVDKNKLYVGGLNMWGSEDGGVTWNGMSNWLNTFGESLHADQHYYDHNPLTGKYYICNDGGLYSTDKLELGSWDQALNSENYEWPTQWSKMSGGMNATSFYRLGLSKNNPGYVIAGSQDNSTYFYNTNEWRNVFGGDGMQGLIHPDDPKKLLMSYQNGNFATSNDGGISLNTNVTANIVNSELGAWTTPVVRHPDIPEIIYGAWGNLWRSDDDGNTWTKKSSLPNIAGVSFPLPSSALAVSKSNPAQIVIAKRPFLTFGNNTELWKTTNGGVTWQNLSSNLPNNTMFITSIVIDDNTINNMWISVSGFDTNIKVFHSKDGGISWQNFSAGLPNVPVNGLTLVEGSSENFLYAATDAGVYYINDNIDRWELYSADLPNVIVSDLEAHIATNKLYASTFGRGVWEVDLIAYTPVDETVTNIEVDLLAEMSINVFPNPSSNFFNLKLENITTNEAVLDIIDIHGRKLHTERLMFLSNTFQKAYKLDLKYGLYFAKISQGLHSRSIKFIVE